MANRLIDINHIFSTMTHMSVALMQALNIVRVMKLIRDKIILVLECLKKLNCDFFLFLVTRYQ